MLHPFAELHATGQNGAIFKSKKALRDALNDAPGFVVWRVIGTPQTGFWDEYLTTAELIEQINGPALVVGPIPETDRRYYGEVKVKGGRIVIS